MQVGTVRWNRRWEAIKQYPKIVTVQRKLMDAQNTNTPKEEWIQGIIYQADQWNVPIFLKDNLKQYWPGELRQEFPK